MTPLHLVEFVFTTTLPVRLFFSIDTFKPDSCFETLNDVDALVFKNLSFPSNITETL